MFGYSLYMQSPEYDLDQTPSYEAINVMQNFINQYPTSEFAKNAGGIVNELELKLEKKEFEAKKFVSYKDRFQPFLIAGFLLLLIEILLFETQTKWVLRMNLFNENKKK